MFIRKYWLPLSVLVVMICAVGLYYLQTQPPKEPIVIIKPVEPLPKSEVKVPEGDTSQGGHVHEDGTWHEGPHEAEAPVEQPPTAQVSEPVEKPAYIYDPDAKERPEGWDPELVFDAGHGKKIDLNYRPLTEEEQAEYERLKATENPEHYGDKWESGLRITAIGNLKQKNSKVFLQALWEEEDAGKITREEVIKRLRDYYEFFTD